MILHSLNGARFTFSGPMGERIRANTDNWLLCAPIANPGMLEMFRLRDRQPVPNLVPWAGEFVGKYLISAVQACRISDDPRLRPFVADIISELISTQAADGYLGPFRQEERLLGHWDLWGHYHVMLALLMWHQDTGDQAALQCAIRAGDLVCKTFLDTGRRVWDAGSHEMNMSIIHSLGWLYRLTGAERYLRMMREIEADWERPPAGDYVRTGVSGIDFYRTPKPRWESLHDLQGLVELYRITGDERYRQAFVQHWTSIRNYDRHPSGGFSTGEQAIGNPYSEGAIETCCTTAWMALSVDMLRLTGDPAAADELELATWNSMLGSQHPSGRWWTYNTPVDGFREASAHTIVFQARVGTPELNCCSVNAPRGLGMLSEWAVMADEEGLAVNYYGPCEARLRLSDGSACVLREETEYPREGTVRLTVGVEGERELTLRLRIPAWSNRTGVSVNGEPQAGVQPGTYLALSRRWREGDTITLTLDMSLRHWSGELSKQGRAAIYRGPLLLACDQKHNSFDMPEVPTLDLAALEPTPARAPGRFQPLVLLKVRGADGRDVLLCDFATAGAHGTHYRAWLPASHGLPAPFYLKWPADGARVPAGQALFEWTSYRSSAAAGRTFRLELADEPTFAHPLTVQGDLERSPATPVLELPPGEYWWRVVAVNAHGERPNELGPRHFTVDASLPALELPPPREAVVGEHGLLVAAPLNGTGEPSFGRLGQSMDVAPAADRYGAPGKALAFNGQTSKLTYEVPYFPEEEYTACVWVCPEGLPTDRLQQVFSAWARSMDDPLRIVLDGHQVFARIEAGAAYGTSGVPLHNGQWVHVAAVKQDNELRLYVNGELQATAAVPTSVFSAAGNVGIGCNPNYGGNECLVGKLDDFALYAAALTPEQIAHVYQTGRPLP